MAKATTRARARRREVKKAYEVVNVFKINYC